MQNSYFSLINNPAIYGWFLETFLSFHVDINNVWLIYCVRGIPQLSGGAEASSVPSDSAGTERKDKYF